MSPTLSPKTSKKTMDRIKNIRPDDLSLIGKKEFDVVVQVTFGLLSVLIQYFFKRLSEWICKKYSLANGYIPSYGGE